MAIDLSSYKVATNEGSSATKFDALVQALEDALNNLGNATYGAFAAGAIFDPTKIKQSGAASGQVLMWSGSAWAPATPPASVYTLIQDSSLGADGTVSLTPIANSYKQLQLVCYLRTDRAATEDDLGVRFNGDTGANYDGYSVKYNGNTPTTAGAEALAATSIKLTNAVPGNNATANVFGSVTITIPNYAGTANQKALHALAGKKIGTAAGNMHVIHGAGAWRSTSAITRIDLLPLTGTNFKAGSRVTLYGL